MITQIIIPYTLIKNSHSDNRSEDFTFEGKFPSKKDLINHIKSLISSNVYFNKIIYQKCLKVVKSIKPKHWPILNSDMSITTPGSVEFEKDIMIMHMIDSPFNKNIGITIVWKILTPCILK
jgi:hypothetical protein